jgi:hypothetical protein
MAALAELKLAMSADGQDKVTGALNDVGTAADNAGKATQTATQRMSSGLGDTSSATGRLAGDISGVMVTLGQLGSWSPIPIVSGLARIVEVAGIATGAALNFIDMQRAMNSQLDYGGQYADNYASSMDDVASATGNAAKASSDNTSAFQAQAEQVKATNSGLMDTVSTVAATAAGWVKNKIEVAAVAVLFGVTAAAAFAFYETLKTIWDILSAIAGFITGLFSGDSMKNTEVDWLVDATKKVEDFRVQMEMTTEEAQTMQNTMSRMNLNSGDVTTVKNNAESIDYTSAQGKQLDDLGLVYKNNAKELLDFSTVAANAVKVLDTYTEGTERNQVAVMMGLGSYGQLKEAMQVNDDQIEKSKARMSEYQILIGPETVAAVAAYKVAQAGFNQENQNMGDSVKRVWADLTIPIFTEMYNLFKGGFPSISQLLRDVTGNIALWGYTFRFALESVWETSKLVIKDLVTGFSTLGQVIMEAVTGSFAAIPRLVQEAQQKALAAWNTLKTNINGDYGVDQGAINMAQGQYNKGTPEAPDKNDAPDSNVDKLAAEKSLLSAQQELYNLQDQYVKAEQTHIASEHLVASAISGTVEEIKAKTTAIKAQIDAAQMTKAKEREAELTPQFTVVNDNLALQKETELFRAAELAVSQAYDKAELDESKNAAALKSETIKEMYAQGLITTQQSLDRQYQIQKDMSDKDISLLQKTSDASIDTYNSAADKWNKASMPVFSGNADDLSKYNEAVKQYNDLYTTVEKVEKESVTAGQALSDSIAKAALEAQKYSDSSTQNQDAIQRYATEQQIQSLQIQGLTITAQYATDAQKYIDLKKKGYTDEQISMQQVNDQLSIQNTLWQDQEKTRKALEALQTENSATAASLVGTNASGGFDSIADQTANQLAVQQQAHDARMKQIQDEKNAQVEALMAGTASYKDYSAQIIALDDKASLERQKNDQATNKINQDSLKAQLTMAATYTSTAGNLFTALASTQDTASRHGFETAKAYNIAAAVMSTAAAIMNAMATVPYPACLAAAAVAAATGAIQIAKIESTSFGGGAGSVSAPSGSFADGGASGGGSTTGIGTYTPSPLATTLDTETGQQLDAIAKNLGTISISMLKVADTLTTITNSMKTGSGTVALQGAPGLYTSLNSHTTGAGFTVGMDNGQSATEGYVNKDSGNWWTGAKPYTVDTGAADPTFSAAISKSISDIVGSIRTGIVALGGSGAGFDQTMQTTSVAPISVGTAGKSQADILKELQAAFVNISSTILDKTIPDLKSFAISASETATDVFSRLVSSITNVNTNLSLVGANPIAPSLNNAAEAYNLQDSMGGADKFNTSIKDYFTAMFTSVQQQAMTAANDQKQVDATFAQLGTAVPKTNSEFIQLVDSLDLTTAQGAATFQTLMGIAPAFGDLTTYIDATTKASTDLANSLDVRAMNASGQSAAASILNLQIQQQTEYTDTVNKGLDTTQLLTVQAMEMQKALQDSLNAMQSFNTGVDARQATLDNDPLQATILNKVASNQQELNDAYSKGYDVTKLLTVQQEELTKAISDYYQAETTNSENLIVRDWTATDKGSSNIAFLQMGIKNEQELADARAKGYDVTQLLAVQQDEYNKLAQTYYQQAVDYNNTLAARMATALGDTGAASVINKLMSNEQELSDARTKGYDTTNLALVQSIELTNVFKQSVSDFGVTIKNSMDTAKDSVTQLTTLQTSAANAIKSILGGNLSTLSPQDAYNQQQALWASTLSSANQGDQSAQANLGAVGQSLLTASQKYYASGVDYQKDYQTVMSALSSQAGLGDSSNATLLTAQKQLDTLSSISTAITDGNASLVGTLKQSLGYDSQMVTALNQLIQVNSANIAGANAAMNGSATVSNLSLPAFADGGITSGLSIAGENGPEAVVPLPDGRTIPVRMYGQADNGALLDEIRALRQEVADLRTERNKADIPLLKVNQAGFNKLAQLGQGQADDMAQIKSKVKLEASR